MTLRRSGTRRCGHDLRPTPLAATSSTASSSPNCTATPRSTTTRRCSAGRRSRGCKPQARLVFWVDPSGSAGLPEQGCWLLVLAQLCHVITVLHISPACPRRASPPFANTPRRVPGFPQPAGCGPHHHSCQLPQRALDLLRHRRAERGIRLLRLHGGACLLSSKGHCISTNIRRNRWLWAMLTLLCW